LSIEQVANAVDIAIHKLPRIESLHRQILDEVDKLQYNRQGLVADIEARKNKISILDKTAFFSEQECKRTEHRVQELTAQKDRLEKMIANILNGEGYSKLNQIAKESIKALLANNKELISASFAAQIQTSKNHPQKDKLIYKIASANDGENKDNNDNDNIIKYLESNKDSLLHLDEKNYEKPSGSIDK
jgi:hypothetical protein